MGLVCVEAVSIMRHGSAFGWLLPDRNPLVEGGVGLYIASCQVLGRQCQTEIVAAVQRDPVYFSNRVFAQNDFAHVNHALVHVKHNGLVGEAGRVSGRAMEFVNGSFAVALSIFDDFCRGKQVDDALLLGRPT